MERIKKGDFRSIIGIVCGVVIIILGIIMLTQGDIGSVRSTSTSFGADFYTEVYQATAVAGRNVKELGELIAKGFGFLLLAIGLTDICLFGTKIAAKEKTSTNEEVKNNEIENIE